MREDPDVILVGELRDADTISMAMTAAETGHLVLGTLHTTSATKTIDRIIDALPIEQREQTKSFLSSSLLAVVTQVLVKTADDRSRRALCEVMVMTRAIAKLIQTDQTFQIPSQLQTNKDLGSQLMDQALLAALAQSRSRHRRRAVLRAGEAAFQKYISDTDDAAEARSRGQLRRNPMAQIDDYLSEVLDKKGSDLHFIAGDPPRLRLHGDLLPLRDEILCESDFVKEALFEIMPQHGQSALRDPGWRGLRLHTWRREPVSRQCDDVRSRVWAR